MVWLYAFGDWVWYYRRGKVKYRVFYYGDTYCASASNGNTAVHNCYGSTPEQAKEMALFKLKKALNGEPKEKELVLQGEHYVIYRDK